MSGVIAVGSPSSMMSRDLRVLRAMLTILPYLGFLNQATGLLKKTLFALLATLANWLQVPVRYSKHSFRCKCFPKSKFGNEVKLLDLLFPSTRLESK